MMFYCYELFLSICHSVSFLLFLLSVFVLVFLISFSFLLMFIQSLLSFFYFIGFFSFLVSYYSYGGKKSMYLINDKSFSSSMIGFSSFVFFYFIFESYLNFIFLCSYFLSSVSFEVVLLFKQGIFPFLFYSFLVVSLSLSVYFINLCFLVFLFWNKVWCFLLFSSLLFCLEFYFSYVFISLFLVLNGFSNWFSFFINNGIVLNNLLFFLLWEVFGLEVVITYSLVLIYYYSDLFFCSLFNVGSKFSSLFLVFNFIHGGFFNFIIYMKVGCLIGFLQYGGFIFVFYFLVVSFVYLFYSLIGLIFLIKSIVSLEVSFIISFFNLLWGFFILSILYEVFSCFLYLF